MIHQQGGTALYMWLKKDPLKKVKEPLCVYVAKIDIGKIFIRLEMDSNFLDPRNKVVFLLCILQSSQQEQQLTFVMSQGEDGELRRKRKRNDEPKARSSKNTNTSIKESTMTLIMASSSDGEPEEKTKPTTKRFILRIFS